MDLYAFVRPDETALQLFARNATEPIPTGVFLLGTVRPGQILEIAGPSGSGKTTLLLQIAANAILPASIDGANVGGLQEHVLMIDLDNKTDILRLMGMMNARIQPALAALSRDTEGPELDRIMEESMNRFHLVRCSHSREMLAALKTSPAYISELQNAGGMHLLLLDNVAAFYWMDAAARNVGGGVRHGRASSLTLNAVHATAAFELKALAKQLRLAVVATKHAFRADFGPSGEDGEVRWNQKEVMSKPWADAVSQRLLLRHASGGVGALPSKFAAKWDKPLQPQTRCFAITDNGVVLCSEA